ncbi:hypothetical protein ACWC5I_47835, partial [Kitasatospora sp. NPDC001574]
MTPEVNLAQLRALVAVADAGGFGAAAAELGIYRKIKLRAQTLDGDVPVWTYVLNDYEGGLP